MATLENSRRELEKQRIHHAIMEASRKHGVPAALVRAVARTESQFQPRAVSPAGAMGVMQLGKVVQGRVKGGDPLHVGENVDAGTGYLKELMGRYDGDIEKVLAAYNAGPTAVDKHGGVPPFPETERYVRKVLGYMVDEEGMEGPRWVRKGGETGVEGISGEGGSGVEQEEKEVLPEVTGKEFDQESGRVSE